MISSSYEVCPHPLLLVTGRQFKNTWAKSLVWPLTFYVGSLLSLFFLTKLSFKLMLQEY